MRYIPITDLELEEMLREIGLKSIDELFETIPEEIRKKGDPTLPPPLSEWELKQHFHKLLDRANRLPHYRSFLGAGLYRHYIPSVVQHLISRSEFYTPYTPYQPEINQGTLQAIYEYQTLICQLTGMDLANASLYDGASALAEAVLMAHRINHRRRVLVARTVHPSYRAVLKTYTQPLELQLEEIPYTEDGTTDRKALMEILADDCSAVVLQTPNFFGCLERLDTYGELAHRVGALFIVVIVEALSLGILRPPADYEADIVVGEGQSFGLPLNFGGPLLGFLATRRRYLRNLPGRLVGEAEDAEGRQGYVLVLATREQHIRRERATSNICTNQSLCALAATIYLATMGKKGLRELAILNAQKAHYAKTVLSRDRHYRLRFESPIFNEFVLTVPVSPEKIIEVLLEEEIIAGLDLGEYYPELGPAMLWCVTELNSKEEIDQLAGLLAKI